MSEFDIDAEFQNLVKSEQEKAQPYVESVQAKRDELVELFYEHVVTVSMFSDEYTAEEQFSRSEDQQEYEDDVCAQLDEMVQTDLERYDVLTQGEMQVKGTGIYISDFDGQGTPVEELHEGTAMNGTIDVYSVAPLVNMKENSDEAPISIPGLWVTLDNAVISGAEGNEIARHERVLVPVSTPGLKFGKVIRRPSRTQSTEEIAIESTKPNIREVLTGHSFQERSTEIENDLNYNEYDAEELQEIRREYQRELNKYVEEIELDETLTVTIINALIPTGGTIDLFALVAYYDRPTIIKFSNSWRVAHGFTILNSSGEIEKIVHALPESIKEAYRNL